MIDKIKSIIETKYTDYDIKVEQEEDKEKDKDKKTLTAMKGFAKGFEIELKKEEEHPQISFTSKIRNYALLLAIGIAVVLMFIYGSRMLIAMGLVSNTGRTLRAFYVIPAVIFLIPSFIVIFGALKFINPVDKELLNEVKETLKKEGIESQID
ncbi:hypothetical protein [Spirochaeta cellobiosiphila]|uniref:hypothetical protein n=1 Tax=Spirochaeta cellobiosiphila TaxID=504483 RepID=UPI000404A9D5|nr:hypothetical protein [Spirochaeta cellobiosiphila]